MKTAFPLLTATAIVAFATGPAFALDDARLNSQLLKLDPETRLEQTCDTEVMFRINKEQTGQRVDKVIAYTFSDPEIADNSINAPGAVFRSKGSWYRLSYTCQTGPHHLDAHKLDYEIGEKIPRAKWPEYHLYD